ncbi:MAG: hypothetical protein ACLFNO_01080 [Parcubacteria group bacterium]
MRNYLIMLLLLFVASSVNAQIVQKNEQGQYRVVEKKETWENTGITTDEGARDYKSFFDEAINNPGTPITVEESEKIVKMKPVFKKLVKFKKTQILYNQEDKTISLIETEPQTKEEGSYIILFPILSLVFMIISYVLFKRRNDNFTFIPTFFVLIATIVTVLTAFIGTSTFISFVAAFSASFALGATTYKHFKVASIIFYILMTIHIVLLFV